MPDAPAPVIPLRLQAETSASGRSPGWAFRLQTSGRKPGPARDPARRHRSAGARLWGRGRWRPWPSGRPVRKVRENLLPLFTNMWFLYSLCPVEAKGASRSAGRSEGRVVSGRQGRCPRVPCLVPLRGCPDTTLTEAGKHSAHSEIIFVKCNNKKNETKLLV